MTNQYVTGAMIKRLREKRHFTQAELAEKICVTDKAVSKWETGRGLPDISLLEVLAKSHYISFIAAIRDDGIESKKLYPEQEAQARFKISGVKKIYAYCNRHGLFDYER